MVGRRVLTPPWRVEDNAPYHFYDPVAKPDARHFDFSSTDPSIKGKAMTMKTRTLCFAVAAAVCVATAPSPSFAANQYWVGGASGLWGDANWADAAVGTGAAWTDSNRAYFTTSPSTIDLNGASPTASDFYTTGFSEANRCAINITNTSETPSTITFSNLNRSGDEELAFADLVFSNVSVVDKSTWAFEIFSGTRITFGEGATYTRPKANSDGGMYVGFSLDTSNSVAVASGATVSIAKDLWIGCSRQTTYAACTGVVYVAGGTLNVAGGLRMGWSTSGDGTGNAGHGVLIVENGGVVNVVGGSKFGCKWNDKNQKYTQSSEIYVNAGGTLNLAKTEMGDMGKKTIVIDGGLLKTSANFESQYSSSGLYKSNSSRISVVNGGVLEVGGNFYVNSFKDVDVNENILFDGGTFRAGKGLTTLSSSAGNGDYTDLLVGAGGMTIDTQGYTLTWQTRIDESEGKVTKKGSGKLNLNWTTYNAGGFDVDEGTLSFGGTETKITSGPLTVKSGATLEKQTGNNPAYLAQSVVFKDGAKLNIPYSNGAVGAVSANAITLEGALEVSFSATPAPGAYPLLTILGEGTFDASALEGITLPDDPAFAGAMLSLSANAKSVVLILSSDPVWIGGTSGDLGVASNWSNGVVPQAGTNAIITAAAAAFLTNSAAFTAKSITFSAGCPKVTIEGAPLEDMVAINNLSSANHEFKTAVTADTLIISNTTTYCVFTGGLTVNSVEFAIAENTKADIYGVWHIKGDWHPVKGNRLYDGATVTVDGTLVDPDNLCIESGCVVTAATLNATGSCNHLSYRSHGRLVVTGACSIETSTTDCYLVREADNSGSTMEFGSLYVNTPGKWTYASAKNIIVGADGITCDTRVQCSSGPALYSRTGRFSVTGTSNFGCDSSGLTIHTTQYETENTPATIVFDIPVADRSDKNKGWIEVKGCGTVLFNSVSTFSDGLTVSSGATAAVNPGMRPGNSTVTVRGGATLKVAQSGTVALNGGLTLDDGAALGFNFTEKRTVPVLNVTGRTVTVNGTVSVKISAADGIKPKGGNHTLTSGGKFAGANVSLAAGAPTWVKGVSVVDGEIVLTVKRKGFVVFVK